MKKIIQLFTASLLVLLTLAASAQQFSKADNAVITNEVREVLLKIYRHGMAYGYFPQLGLGISYHSGHSDKSLFFKGDTGNTVLNVNELEKIVIKKLDEIVFNNSAFPKMEDQFTFLEKESKNNFGNLIRKLEAQIS